MGILAMFRRRPHERAGFELYGAAVGAARTPALFAVLGVPDTVEGRFDLIALQVGLLISRLRRDGDPRGPALAQAVFDAMFSDMDQNLREMGVGDLSVGKKVRQAWEAFHGRALAYEAALELGRRGGAGRGPRPQCLAQRGPAFRRRAGAAGGRRPRRGRPSGRAGDRRSRGWPGHLPGCGGAAP